MALPHPLLLILDTQEASDCVQKLSEAEFIGRFCAQRLLLEIHYGGVIDTTFQYIPLLFMVMAEEHAACKVSSVFKDTANKRPNAHVMYGGVSPTSSASSCEIKFAWAIPSSVRRRCTLQMPVNPAILWIFCICIIVCSGKAGSTNSLYSTVFAPPEGFYWSDIFV